MLAGVGLVEMERTQPQLQVPPGTFCCCPIDKLACESSGDSRLHLVWMRVAFFFGALIDFFQLRFFVAHGSSALAQEHPVSAYGRIRLLLSLLAVCCTVVSVFMMASFSASCGCLLHP